MSVTLTPEAVVELAERLAKLPSVNRYDHSSERQGDTIAHAASDIERSCRELIEVIFPKLLDQALDQRAIEELLFDIGEELRHIIYHARDVRYFSYLFEGDAEA